MFRREDWPEQLANYIAESATKPFAWGEHDCILFAVGAIRAVGVEVDLKVTWKTELGAAKELKKRGGFESAISKYLGDPLEYAGLAKRGDIGLSDSELGLTATVFDGLNWLGAGERGLVVMQAPNKVWSVG
jgi:hypothetical protein